MHRENDGYPFLKVGYGFKDRLKTLTRLTGELIDAIEVLRDDEKKVGSKKDAAGYCAKTIRPHMERAREISDALETIVDSSDWPLPNYDEMLIL